jgi:protein involved in polysaccharide export with SLBB domain
MGYRFFLLIAALLVVLTMPGMRDAKAQAPGNSPAASAAPGAATFSGNDYHLGSGDKIHVSVFGQTDLNGDFVVDGAGSVQLPLIGLVQAAGLTVAQFQKEITVKYADGFLVNPNVEVDVSGYRPFYIIGEVKTPGQYAYVNGMSILNAVALAGGFSDRADKSEVYIRRNGASKEAELPADETTKVNPGDIIRISERFF